MRARRARREQVQSGQRVRWRHRCRMRARGCTFYNESEKRHYRKARPPPVRAARVRGATQGRACSVTLSCFLTASAWVCCRCFPDDVCVVERTDYAYTSSAVPLLLGMTAPSSPGAVVGRCAQPSERMRLCCSLCDCVCRCRTGALHCPFVELLSLTDAVALIVRTFLSTPPHRLAEASGPADRCERG